MNSVWISFTQYIRFMAMMFFVGLGSMIGGMLRYAISTAIQRSYLPTFPYHTLIVNLAGCFAMGLAMGYVRRLDFTPHWQSIITSGLIGGFTTFSAFSAETFSLIESGNIVQAMAYVLTSVCAGLICLWLGCLIIEA